jgi:hypothetical protein
VISQTVLKKIKQRKIKEFLLKYVGPFMWSFVMLVSIVFITPQIQHAQFIDTIAQKIHTNEVVPAQVGRILVPTLSPLRSPCADFQTAAGVIYKGDNAMDIQDGNIVTLKPIYTFSPSTVSSVDWTNNTPAYIKLSGGVMFHANPYYSIDVRALQPTQCDHGEQGCVYGSIGLVVHYHNSSSTCTSSLKVIVK